MRILTDRMFPACRIILHAEGISASELKARFDNIGKMMIALGKHNELIDALMDTEAGEKRCGKYWRFNNFWCGRNERTGCFGKRQETGS